MSNISSHFASASSSNDRTQSPLVIAFALHNGVHQANPQLTQTGMSRRSHDYFRIYKTHMAYQLVGQEILLILFYRPF
jgi:hypothetical protein